jgi:ankyrin repeat protein
MNINPIIVSPYIPPVRENQEDAKKREELFCAIDQANVAEVTRLLSLGYDPNSKDAVRCLTVLEAALKLFDSKKPKTHHTACSIVQLLLEAGAEYTGSLYAQYLNLFDYAFATTNYGLLFAIHTYYTPQLTISRTSWHAFFLESNIQDLDFIARYYPVQILQIHLENTIVDSSTVYKNLFELYHLLFEKNRNHIPHPDLFLRYYFGYTKPLFEIGIDGAMKDGDGNTPLHYLAQGKGDTEILPLLLSHTPNLLLANLKGLTPLDIALRQKNVAFLEELQKHDVCKTIPRPALHEAIIAHDISKVEKEYKNFDLQTMDIFGNTAFEVAIRHRFFPAVTLLAEFQAPSEKELFLATVYSNADIVSFLATRIDVTENLVLQMYKHAFQSSNDQVTIWILETYAHLYPALIKKYIAAGNITETSLPVLHKCVERLLLIPASQETLKKLLYAALRENVAQIPSLLLNYIDNSSDIEDIVLFYHLLFGYKEKEFVEKAIKKFGIPDICLQDELALDHLLTTHPTLFRELIPEIQKKTPFYNKSTNQLHAVLLAGSEDELYAFGQNYQKQPTPINFRALYRDYLDSRLSKERRLEVLVRVLKLQRADFAAKKEDLEELACAIIQTDKMAMISEWPSTTLPLSELVEVCKALAKYVEKLPPLLKIPFGCFSVKKTTQWFIEQLFCNIRVQNQLLFSKSDIFDTILDLLAKIREPNDYEVVLSALKTAPNKEAIFSLFSENNEPSKTQAKALPQRLPEMIEPRDSQGKTELFRAAERGNVSEVRRLLRQGSDPNSIASDSSSVLKAALLSQSPKTTTIVQLLVTHGALCNQMFYKEYPNYTQGYLNIFDYAFRTQNYGLLFSLHTYFKPYFKLDKAALNAFFSLSSVQDFEFIIRHYPNVELRSDLFTTLIANQRLDLLKKYQQIKPQDFEKFIQAFPLTITSCSAPEIARFLRTHGASFAHDPLLLMFSAVTTKEFLQEGMNVNIQDSLGYSALHYIANPEFPRSPLLLPLLLDAGANPLLVANDGTTPLYIASKCGNVDFTCIVSKFMTQKSTTSPYLALFEHMMATYGDLSQKIPSLIVEALEIKELQLASLFLTNIKDFHLCELFINQRFIASLRSIMPDLFHQLLEGLFERLFLLFQNDQVLMPLAILSGKQEKVDRMLCGQNWDIRALIQTAITLDTPELIPYFYKKIPKLQNLTEDLGIAINLRNKDSRRIILSALLQYTKPCLAQPEADEIAKQLAEIAEFSKASELIETYMQKACKEECEKLALFVPRVFSLCKIPLDCFSLHETAEWFVIQTCFHCREMNPKLFSEPDVFESLLKLLALVSKNEDYGSLLVALQVAPGVEVARLAFQAAQALDAGDREKPSKEKFFLLSQEEQKQWLAFALVYRDRAFLPSCYHIIKHHEKFLPLLSDALNAFQQIGIKRYSSKLENSAATDIQKILQKDVDETIKVAALHAYIEVSYLSHNPDLLDFLLLLLVEARKQKSIAFETALILTLGTSYEWTSDQECDKAAKLLMAGLQSEHEDVRYLSAIALTSIPHEQGLLAALAVVKTDTWDRMHLHFGKDRQTFTGSFLMFRSRPFQIHDSRSAMCARIAGQLIRLHEKNPQFCTWVEQSPNFDEIRKKVETLFQSTLSGARYLPLPIVYPPNTDLIRGLSTRKGATGFREALRDLLRKGSGSSQLTDHDATVGGNTWNKIGHSFASHSKDLHFGQKTGSIYFSTDQNGKVTESALIIFPAAYYEKEYFAGQARLEREGTLNNVLYRGIPHRWIKRIYLPERFKADMDLLSGNTPLESVEKALTSDLFQGDTIKELDAFRRLLQAKEMDLTQEPAKLISFGEKIRYFLPVDAQEVGELLVRDGISFATEEEIKKETAKFLIKKQVLATKLYKTPWNFSTQDTLLRSANDKEFKENIERFLQMLPKQLRPSKFECPETDSNEKSRALLRVAALLRSTGKQVHDIGNPLFYGLTKEDIPLLASLIS